MIGKDGSHGSGKSEHGESAGRISWFNHLFHNFVISPADLETRGEIEALALCHFICHPDSHDVGIRAGPFYLGKPTLTAFINMMPAYKEVKNSQSGEVYLRGKVIIIDKYIDRLHDLYYKLPDEIKAKTPEEVSTVVIVNCTGTVKFYEVFGTSRKPVYDSSSCDADIIDWKIPAILSTYQNSQLGASPGMMANDLMKYLLSLPRKED